MTYIAIYNDNYLAHHGVKGMKWGVRRQRKADKRSKNATDFTSNAKSIRAKLDKGKNKPLYDTVEKAMATGNERLLQKHLPAYSKALATGMHTELRKSYSNKQINNLWFRDNSEISDSQMIKKIADANTEQYEYDFRHNW